MMFFLQPASSLLVVDRRVAAGGAMIRPIEAREEQKSRGRAPGAIFEAPFLRLDHSLSSSLYLSSSGLEREII